MKTSKRKITMLTLLIALAMLTCTTNKQSSQKTYTNPVIQGEIPDPSIIRVGETYYATGTSFDFAPNYPIYQSNDLINWHRIGSVFITPPTWASDDFWAPELYYNDGTFFVYYTTKRKDNNVACIGVATTDNIANGFIDQGIIIEWGEEAIDAFVFQDDDGKRYITWKAYGLTEGREVEILASQLEDDGLSLKGDHFTLTDHTKGWNGFGDEGQCLFKHKDYYYLLYSIGGCCDNKCDYRVMVARSKTLKSGWEQFPEPILKGGREWRCPGHGTLVKTDDDRYFYLYHSYNATDFEFIGRQGLIDELFWNKNSHWPFFKNEGTPSVTAPVPFKLSTQERDAIFYQDFSTNELFAYWEWDVNHPKPQYTIADNKLQITTSFNGYNFLGIRPKTGNYSLNSEVNPTTEFSGISIYSNADNMLNLVVNQSEIELFQIKNGNKEVLYKESIAKKGTVFLRYEARAGRYFKFSWSRDGSEWYPINPKNNSEIDGTFIAQWGYSPRIGFIVMGNNNTAKFSKFEIQYKSEQIVNTLL